MENSSQEINSVCVIVKEIYDSLIAEHLTGPIRFTPARFKAILDVNSIFLRDVKIVMILIRLYGYYV